MAADQPNETKISPESIIVVIQDQVSVNLEDEAVILSLKDGVYYGLNPVGAMIWRLIQEPHTFGEIKKAILAEYDVDPQRCEQDLNHLLHEMGTKGLIAIKDEQAS